MLFRARAGVCGRGRTGRGGEWTGALREHWGGRAISRCVRRASAADVANAVAHVAAVAVQAAHCGLGRGRVLGGVGLTATGVVGSSWRHARGTVAGTAVCGHGCTSVFDGRSQSLRVSFQALTACSATLVREVLQLVRAWSVERLRHGHSCCTTASAQSARPSYELYSSYPSASARLRRIRELRFWSTV